MIKNDIKEKFMLKAIKLAEKGIGAVNPNPLVGAVIVKNGKIIGQGYHVLYGGLHAERNAFLSLKESAEDSDLYVTLEPCNHYGKTPPCTEAIIENKVKRVIIGSSDPNPLVCGKGISRLREAGIDVITGFLKEKCDALNSIFFHFIKEHTPYVLLKYAMTLDGKIATKNGQSKWISGKESREYVQYLRNKYSAIMVGINTVITDDPLLTCRLKGKRSPVRIICDSNLKINLNSQIVKTADKYKTIIACASVNKEKEECLVKKGIQVVCFNKENKVDLPRLMSYLGKQNIDSILLEGGGTLNEAMLKENLVNEINVFIAPKIFGGNSKTPVMGEGVADITDAYNFHIADIRNFGNDIMVSCLK